MLEKLRQHGVVPAIAVDSAEDGLRLCETLLKAGLPVAEITFRTSAAAETIKTATAHFPELTLGAGTILTPDQLKQAIDAGAKFAVAPGLNPKVVQTAIQANLLFAPGVCTPSEIELALELGCKLLKFFPAEVLGGVKMLKAFIGPYGHTGVQFCPTGGINTQNLPNYLALPQVPFAVGTWIAPKETIRAKNWEQIEQTARDAVAIVKSIRG
jgi:2-dehydro-3-deoxyphosphogluconate aldolase/(4S)-4-hydroxy-2-oxoglutarate aldolase